MMPKQVAFLIVLLVLSPLAVGQTPIGETPVQPRPADDRAHVATGVVMSTDRREGHIEIKHDPIPALDWPQATRTFVVAQRDQLAALKPGQRVRFEMRPIANQYVIGRIDVLR